MMHDDSTARLCSLFQVHRSGERTFLIQWLDCTMRTHKMPTFRVCSSSPPDRALAGVRILVPEPRNRAPLSWEALPYGILCWVPYVSLAYLSRRPNTQPIRLLLLPVVIVSLVWTGHAFIFTDPKHNSLNWGLS